MLIQAGYGIIISEKDGVCISFQNQIGRLENSQGVGCLQIIQKYFVIVIKNN